MIHGGGAIQGGSDSGVIHGGGRLWSVQVLKSSTVVEFFGMRFIHVGLGVNPTGTTFVTYSDYIVELRARSSLRTVTHGGGN